MKTRKTKATSRVTPAPAPEEFTQLTPRKARTHKTVETKRGMPGKPAKEKRPTCDWAREGSGVELTEREEVGGRMALAPVFVAEKHEINGEIIPIGETEDLLKWILRKTINIWGSVQFVSQIEKIGWMMWVRRRRSCEQSHRAHGGRSTMANDRAQT